MKPIDYRNTTWRDVQTYVHADRQHVLDGLRKHGPCTTRELAARMGRDILTIRPRVTELCQLHFVTLVQPEPGPKQPRSGRSKEGVYRALSDEEARTAFESRQSRFTDIRQRQLILPSLITHP